ncbi:MAG: hypothetical protein C5B50_04125 [Verrucomicrobia bacterium]|nr:MAG: hypothetical protein C5B50_04125 [Verrucomicrobiota bacterium]
MNFRFTVVETSLNRAEFRWKWLRFVRESLLLGTILCFGIILMGGAILGGVIASKPIAITLYVVLAAAGIITWTVLLITIASASPARPWLAAALEKVDKRLLDRLNTLVHLEGHPPEAQAESFARRIAKQTQSVLAKKTPEHPFNEYRTRAHFLVFLATIAATIFLYAHYSPWLRLKAPAQIAKNNSAAHNDKALDLGLPPTNNVEQNQAWGEVRITDPGTDLRVTKVDVVPLQIEAAANQTLDQINWFSAINGSDEAEHKLPPPSEPRYAVYQPTLYLDELQLSDWDVMTYYAKASTEKNDSYASEVYFLEVRPFREDILKLPGGETGQAYRFLSELSSLINRQQHVIRQTHQHIQRPPVGEKLQAQDRKKLSEAEGDLGDSTQHLYAQMAGELENKPIGEALDNLAKAEQSLDRASRLLQDNSMNDARNKERSALSELAAARKSFQKAITDNPKSFEDQKQDEEPTPVADASSKLKEMAEFRNESKAAQDFVRQTLEQQKTLEQQARAAQRSDFSRLADQERQLQQKFEDFREQHPQAFSPLQLPADEAREGMNNAADSLQRKSPDARNATHLATQNLQKLNDSMKGQAADQQLADAYKLKQMLDQEIAAFDGRSKTNSGMSEAQLQKEIEASRKTLDQLKSTAEQDPTRNAFGPALRDSLSDQKRAELNSRLNQLQYAEEEQDKEARAGQARDGLGKVSKAFTESQPKSLQMAQQNDALKPNADESFSQGMAELDSLIRQLESERGLSPQDEARQAHQALQDLRNGMNTRQGNNDQINSILLQFDELLKPKTPLEAANLKKLMSALQSLSLETAQQLAKKEDKPEVTNIDPTHLPPAYRGRIQKYFEKLSEK